MSYTIDPDAVIDFEFDWTDWLAASETISSKVITPSDGITVNSSTIVAGVVTVWVSGATVDTVQSIACRITTNQGRTDERTIELAVRNR